MIEISKRDKTVGNSVMPVSRITMLFNSFVLTIEVEGRNDIAGKILMEAYEISDLLYTTTVLSAIGNIKKKLIKIVSPDDVPNEFNSKYKSSICMVKYIGSQKVEVLVSVKKIFYSKPKDEEFTVCPCGCTNPISLTYCQICGAKITPPKK